jgi:hypothetical protein
MYLTEAQQCQWLTEGQLRDYRAGRAECLPPPPGIAERPQRERLESVRAADKLAGQFALLPRGAPVGLYEAEDGRGGGQREASCAKPAPEDGKRRGGDRANELRCATCGEADSQLCCCCGCGMLLHHGCADPPLTPAPAQQWRCGECQRADQVRCTGSQLPRPPRLGPAPTRLSVQCALS